MAIEIVGREDELSALHAFLDRAGDGVGALVLEGDAGIGKSTLWLAGVEAARDRSLRVLDARPAEAEQGLAHASLGFRGISTAESLTLVEQARLFAMGPTA